jgi:hypothetical protein
MSKSLADHFWVLLGDKKESLTTVAKIIKADSWQLSGV